MSKYDTQVPDHFVSFLQKFVYRNEKIIPLHRRTLKTDFALQAKKIIFLVHEKFFPS